VRKRHQFFYRGCYA